MDIEFRTRQEAENACNKDKNCKAFYDAQSKNDTFILCAAPLTKPSKFENSTLFMKCKVFVIFYPILISKFLSLYIFWITNAFSILL